MVKNNTLLANQHLISANATLSNISTVNNYSLNDKDSKLIDSSLSTSEYQNMKKPANKATKESTPEKNGKNSNLSQDQSVLPNQKTNTKVPISKLSIIAIALTLCLGGFLYYHAHLQAERQKQIINQLQSELANLKQTVTQSVNDEISTKLDNALTNQKQQLTDLTNEIHQQLSDQTQSQQQFFTKTNDALRVSENNIVQLNEHIAALSTTNNNVWLISQANYLVNLAGRKIWNDQDYTTARLLLKNADTSLAQANDPSLLPARQAINQDIAALSAISFTDFDGIEIQLMNLADTVSQLPLLDQLTGKIINNKQLSSNNPSVDDQKSSSSNWYQNLVKTSKSFLSQFIQVEKYDSFNECIAKAGQNKELINECQTHNAMIMPEHAPYLRENIKLKLLIAAQAVPRHQETIYQQALKDAIIASNTYFDHNSASVKAFISELNKLQHQSINNQNVPQQLASYEELNKLMQVRVRAMLNN